MDVILNFENCCDVTIDEDSIHFHMYDKTEYTIDPLVFSRVDDETIKPEGTTHG